MKAIFCMKRNNFKNLAQDWFESADRVLEDAILLYKEGGHSDTICFHCQQVAEKYLKGYIVLNGFDIKDDFKTHNLLYLLEYCLKFNASLEELRQNCLILNRYYLESRYPPDAPKDYPKAEAKQAIEFAKEIKKKISEF